MDNNQSPMLLMNSERFGILLANSLKEGVPRIVEADNIGMKLWIHHAV